MLTRNSLGPFKILLTEALRTTDQGDATLPGRFVELVPGTIETLQADVNQLLTGRRGVGKSTTLAVLQQQAEKDGRRVIFVDVENHKGRSYPDVLIEMILDILTALRPKWSFRRQVRSIRRQVRDLEEILQDLKRAGPEVTHEDERSRTDAKYRTVSLEGSVRKKFLSVIGGVGGGRIKQSNRSSTSSFTKRKEDFLRDLAPALSKTFKDAAGASEQESMMVVLDDFYMIEQSIQPLVLDHLHGITKRTKVWLKIASVRSRTQTFINGDPPVGMQPPGDFRPLPLDIGLEKFPTAKTFLENITAAILEPAGFDLMSVMTPTARERAVLVAGGAVCRDYFDVLIAAADVAWNTAQSKTPQPEEFRISAEDVHAAAGELFDRKLNELRSDAGLDAVALEARFEDILKFVRDRNTFFLLIRRDELDHEWGREVVQLEDLRFLHKIMITRPNTGAWRGVDTVVFMVDIPALVKNRMRNAPIEFWKPGENDRLRRANWIYEPAWKQSGDAPVSSPEAVAPADELPSEVHDDAESFRTIGESP